jgi:hypothetical protein
MATNYYSNMGRKIGDFFIGFAVIPIVAALCVALLGAGFIWLAVCGAIAGTIVCFSIGRRFIAIGLLSTLLIPVLIFGACILALS